MRRYLIAVLAIAALFSGRPAAEKLGWIQADRYTTSQGQTMVVVRGPVSVTMGSPTTEVGREPASDSAAEPLHTVSIRRSFAISVTEITNEQFRQFLEEDPQAKRGYAYDGAPDRMADVLKRFSPDGE